MTTYLKCQTCGGVYPTTQADGTQYFHACAPQRNAATRAWEPRPGARNENVRLDPATRQPTIIAAGGGAVSAAAPVEVIALDDVLSDPVKPVA